MCEEYYDAVAYLNGAFSQAYGCQTISEDDISNDAEDAAIPKRIFAFDLEHQEDQKVYEHVFVKQNVEAVLRQMADSYVIGNYGFLSSEEDFSLREIMRKLPVFPVCSELKGETTVSPEYEVPGDKSDPISLTWDEFRQLAEAEKMTDDNCLKTIKSSNLYYLYDGTKPCVFLWLDHIKEMAEKIGVSFDHIFIFAFYQACAHALLDVDNEAYQGDRTFYEFKEYSLATGIALYLYGKTTSVTPFDLLEIIQFIHTLSVPCQIGMKYTNTHLLGIAINKWKTIKSGGNFNRQAVNDWYKAVSTHNSNPNQLKNIENAL